MIKKINFLYISDQKIMWMAIKHFILYLPNFILFIILYSVMEFIKIN